MVRERPSKSHLEQARTSAKRTLIYVPIIHSEIDMGSLQEAVRRHKIRLVGTKKSETATGIVERIWKEIRALLDSRDLDYAKVRIYQDGLPDCGRETEIITELAKAGSLNYQLLLDLIEKGATVMGTESPDLLVEEYQLIKQSFPQNSGKALGSLGQEKAELSRSLLTRRDKYIADRINQTLSRGEVGVVFIGMLHSLQQYLAPDIQVRPIQWSSSSSRGS